jgi:hypothetical protein
MGALMKIKTTAVIVAILFYVTIGKCGPNGAGVVANNPLNSIVATAPVVQPVYRDPSLDFIPENPWRSLDGETNYIKTDGVEFCGKVVDVTPNGIRVEGEFGGLFETSYSSSSDADYHDFFVAHYPFQAVNDQVIYESEHNMAWSVGTYTYSTAQGGSRTIRKLDYGIPCEAPQKLVERAIAAAAAASKAKEEINRQKIFQAQINTVRWLSPQATNGDASAQCSLGEHYLNGQGCETNQEQGIYWLQKAADQGDLEASNKLEQLKQQK